MYGKLRISVHSTPAEVETNPIFLRQTEYMSRILGNNSEYFFMIVL